MVTIIGLHGRQIIQLLCAHLSKVNGLKIRIGLRIDSVSQFIVKKMLFNLASDNDAFLKVCDESRYVNKRIWNERKDRFERNFKNERIKLRGLLAKQETTSALRGELTDVERAIERLSESAYYTVRTHLNKLESEKSLVGSALISELSLLDSISELIPLEESQFDELNEPSEQYQACLQQVRTIQAQYRQNITQAIEQAREQLHALQSGAHVQELTANVDTSKVNVANEASLLREQGLDPDTLDTLVERKQSILNELREYVGLEDQIDETKGTIRQITLDITEHRKTLTDGRKAFIDSLNLEGLEIKVLPLNASPKSIVTSYQNTTGIAAFTDRIYDEEDQSGLLKAFIEHPTYAPIPAVIDRKYSLLNELKEFHRKIVREELANETGLHGSFKNRIMAMTDESLDNLMCWYPDDGIHIRYRALGGQMEDIMSASPGQKAASMLQFLLSYGTDPLLLDQPEDDLDCMMLSQSVIPAIAANKQRRQLIIVSHSAPIVVNGDAEYVISMIRDRNGLRPSTCGALQSQEVKDLICNQMEGGERAFRSRFSRILN